MTSLTFQNIVDDGALLFLETHHHQDDRFDEWGYERWDSQDQLSTIDFRFTGRPPLTAKNAVFLGTAGPGPRTYLWAWANQQVNTTDAQQSAFDQILQFGRYYGIAEITADEVPFAVLVPAYADEEELLNAAKGGATLTGFKIAVAAKMMTGLPNHVVVDIGQGSTAVVAYQHPELQLGSPSALTFQFRLTEAMAGGLIADHRRAVDSYSRLRAVPATAVNDRTVRLEFEDGFAQIQFDDRGQAADISGNYSSSKP
ncbi:MAG: hypothetical protein NVS3B6_10590 [Pseudarthrobacter sp.]